MTMRLRFSLRFFLIVFTLVAVFLGGGLHYFYQIKDHIKRHKEALATLKARNLVQPTIPKPPKATFYETFVRNWIDSNAFEPVPPFYFGVTLYQLAVMPTDFERYLADDMEQFLELVGDLHGVPEISIAVDRLTVKQGQLIAKHSQLQSLYIDCVQIEPGATRPLQQLRGLKWFCMPGAIDDDAMRVVQVNPRLEGVILNLAKLDERHAALLHNQKQLEHAILLQAGAKTRFLQALAGQTKLTRLVLLGCDVDSATAEVFSQLPRLDDLRIEGDGKVDSQLWAHLPRSTNLKTLDVRVDSRPSPTGVRALAQCNNLEVLDLESVSFASEDLAAFANHPKLKQIRFRGKFADAEIEGFLKTMPNSFLCAYKDSEGFGQGKTGLGLRGKFYRLVKGKLDTSTNPFPGMVRW